MSCLTFLLVLLAGGLGGVVLMCLLFLTRQAEDHGLTQYEPHGCTDLGNNLVHHASKSRQFSMLIED